MQQACLNGARPADTPGLPLSPEAVADDALACRAAGADCLHIHQRDATGQESLVPRDVAAHLGGVRAVAPNASVGISTGDWIEPRASRLDDMRDRTERPDYVSVNLAEPDAPEVIALLAVQGVAVELGLASEADLDRLPALPATMWRGALRALIGMEAGTLDEAMSVAGRMFGRLRRELPDLPILLHGLDATAWAFVEVARDLGCDTRIGPEDCLLLPDGRPAGSAGPVAEATRILRRGA